MQSKITWKQCADLPMSASHGQTTIVKNKVYYGGFETGLDINERTVHCYNPSQDTWSTLPPLSVTFFGLGQVRGQLVAVGGWMSSDRKASSEVHAFDEKSKKWKQSLPSMPTARHSTAVISHPYSACALIVAGGHISDGGEYTDAVEIFNKETSKWHKTDSLRMSCRNISSVIVNGTCYLVGGHKYPFGLNQVLHAHVDQLLQNARPSSQAPSCGTANVQDVSAWRQLTNTQTYQPTAAAFGETILSVGGSNSTKSGSTHSEISDRITLHSPSTDSWIYISDLPAPRMNVAIALVSPTEILVIGGLGDEGQKRTIYSGTLCVSM